MEEKKDKRLKSREEIDPKYKWNIEKMYRNQETWERDFNIVKDSAKALAEYQGHLGDDGKTLLEFLEKKADTWRTFEHLFVYARMRKDEDNRQGFYQTLCERAESLAAELSAALSFYAPELMEIPRERLNGFLKEEMGLHTYVHALRSILRQKEHILSPN